MKVGSVEETKVEKLAEQSLLSLQWNDTMGKAAGGCTVSLFASSVSRSWDL